VIDGSVLIVVVTYESSELIEKCLAAIKAESADVALCTVVVADNASTDDTCARAARALPEAHVLSTGGNLGYATAINRAVSSVEPHDYVLILNPDAVLHRGCIATLVAALADPGRGLAVPRMVDETGRLASSIRQDPSLRTAFAEAAIGGRRAARLGWGEIVPTTDPRYQSSGAVEWATGAAVLISRRCWDAVGDWDESFFLYSEETDYMIRAREAGFVCWYEAAAEVSHRGGESSTSPALWSLMLRNKVTFFSRRHSRATSWLYRMALLLGESVRAAAGQSRARAAVKELRRAH
jgi:N-acetylglucosaminyl-diphospho-decaprenol L-rhamnosyltransferase